MPARTVTFHEGPIAFTWCPASREVKAKDGSIVSRSAFNLKAGTALRAAIHAAIDNVKE